MTKENYKIPVAHLSENYLKEYRSKLLFSVAYDLFFATIDSIQVAALVIIMNSVFTFPVFVMATTFVAMFGIMAFVKFSKAYFDIGKIDELDLNLKNAGEVSINDIPGFRKEDDNAKLELAASSLAEILYKKSKLKENDGDLAKLSISEDYFTNFMAEYYKKNLKKDLMSSFIEGISKQDESAFFMMLLKGSIFGACLSVTGRFFQLATLEPSYAAVGFAAGMFSGMFAIRAAYGTYQEYCKLYKTYNYVFDITKATEITAGMNKVLDRRVRDLKIPESEGKELKNKVMSKFTDLLGAGEGQGVSLSLAY